AAIAVGMILLIKDKFGSMEIIAMPVVIGVLASFIGLTLLPIVSGITLSIGAVINSFTSLQPILMSILIAVSFAALLT
ncbi:PTS sugar transporter subunit IIC, partial [Streptococcus pyogenes]